MENFISTLKARSFHITFVQQYLLDIYHVSDTDLDIGDVAVNKTKTPALFVVVCECVYIEVRTHNEKNIGKNTCYLLINTVENNLKMCGGGDGGGGSSGVNMCSFVYGGQEWTH